MKISCSGWRNSLLLLTITLVKHLRNVQLAFTDSKKMKHSTHVDTGRGESATGEVPWTNGVHRGYFGFSAMDWLS